MIVEGDLARAWFDLPHVMEGALANLKTSEAGDRVQFAVGNFFEGVPSGGDVYFLKTILHDWPDPQALAILKNCRAAIHENGRLYIIGKILPERVEEAPEIVRSNLIMLVEVGGKDRSEKALRDLLRDPDSGSYGYCRLRSPSRFSRPCWWTTVGGEFYY